VGKKYGGMRDRLRPEKDESRKRRGIKMGEIFPLNFKGIFRVV
jgi:hypothetical protein